MSKIQSSSEHLTLNADGSSKDIKFQANGVEKASISSAGAFTSTTIDATKLTGALPAISGAALTGLSASDSTKMPLAGGTFTGGVTFNGTQTLGSSSYWIAGNTTNAFVFNSVGDAANLLILKNDGRLGNPAVSKAHGAFSGNGTPSFWGSNSYNFSSITDVGTGNYRVNFTNNMANVDYDAYCQVGDQITGHVTGRATTYVEVVVRNNSLSTTDTSTVFVNVFNELVGI